MKSKLFMRFIVAISFILLNQSIQAQSYIGYSSYVGGASIEEVLNLQVINGEAYLIGNTRSANFPSTNGTTLRGEADFTITKFSSTGSVIYATYLGGRGNDVLTGIKIINGELFIAGYTDSINYPVTNGTVFRGRRDAVVTKLNASGNIAFSTYLGGIGSDFPSIGGLEVNGNQVIIGGTTGSPDFPVTDNSNYGGGASDGFAAILNATDGSLITSRIIGGNRTDFTSTVAFDNNSIFLISTTLSDDIPATVGGSLPDTVENLHITRCSFNNLNTLYSRYLGGNKSDFVIKAIAENGVLHLTGYSGSSDFPVTNGSESSTQFNDVTDAYYTRLNPDGNIVYSTYLTSNELDFTSQLIIANGDAYIGGTAVSTINGQKSAFINKVNANGTLAYSKRFKIGPLSNNIIPSFELLNNEIYIGGITFSAEYPVTNQSQFYSGGTGFLTRLNTNGDVIFSSYLGNMNNLLPVKTANNKIYLLGNTAFSNYPVTDSSVNAGSTDNVLIILNTDGSRVYSGYTGGVNADVAVGLAISNDEVYYAGKSSSANYPVTNNILYKGSGDQFITKLSFCPTGYFLGNDTLTPGSQTVCRLGLGEKIIGSDMQVPGDSLPQLFLNGITKLQRPVKANYQWQVANTANGPWNDIPAASFKDYTPTLGASDQYYRRVSFTLPECGSSFIHYSDTVAALVNNLIAPTVNMGGTFTTCPGSPIGIGGNPTVSGGNPPYITYAWDNGADSVSNPVVAPNASTIYTLIVTDTLGCKQIGQAIVITYNAKAGPDKGACGGNPTQIGTPPIPGLQGILYNWSPATDLNNSSIAQPFANPSVITDYILSLTIPKSDGTTCETKDTVRVTPVAAPVTPDFAGPDKVFCLESSVTLGKAPEAGFNYVWSPGSYLTSNTFSTTTYYAGNTVMPEPNPAVINVTAQKNGCAFSDQVVVATIEARAGLDGCGPRIIGLPDRTPDINETYSWTIVSGPGTFTGPNNLPQISVSASVGAPTVYGLTVSYNGGSCYDEVTVIPFCSSCQTRIEVDARYSCPSYDANGGNVSLIAYTSIDNAIFRWSPQVGLSAYTGSIVQLTDNVPRVYTVEAIDINDTTIRCSDNIVVNDPAFSRPVFPAPDTVTCVNQPVSIGLPPVAGYTYEWTGNGLSSNLSSNPTATVAVQTAFPVTVTDIGGCILRDTVIVAVQNVQVNGGADWVLCSNGIIRLGSPAAPNTTYLWEPQSAPWQNNTNQFSAQPEVFIATDISFTVTASTSAGCTTTDTVNVTLNATPVLPDAPDTFVCAGSNVQIGLPAIPGVIYQWQPSTGLSNPNIAQPLANPTTTTTYTVFASFPGSCSSVVSDQVTVTVGNAIFSMPDITFCPSDGPVSLGINAPANMQAYSWLPANHVSNATIANPTTLNPPPKAIAVYSLQVTNQDGCRYRDTINLIPLISAPSAGADRLLCKDQTTLIGSAANTTGPGISYSWVPAINLDDPSSPTPVFTATTGGIFTYIVTKTDSNISCSSKDTIVITVSDVTYPPLNSPVVCSNSCTQIGTTPVTGIQYQWTPTTGLSNPNIANPIACLGSSNISYTLTTSAVTGCSYSSTILVSVAPVSAAQIIIPSITACVGDTGIRFNPSITPSGNYTYSWSPNDGTLSDINILNPEILIVVPGVKQYTLQVTDTVTNCSNTSTATITGSNCPQTATIGDFMWYDNNSNGLQDPGETGVSGMLVTLYNNSGFSLGSTFTDPAGFYFFTNVPAGNGYYVIFSKPAGYNFTAQNIGGANAINNNKADANGQSSPFNVSAGSSILNIDAGIQLICPVPVTLISFTATVQNRQVKLNWQTSAEINNAYFIVERSTDGINYSGIGRVNGHGTSTIQHNYSLIDPQPSDGINYYRLRQVDIDGLFSYSEIRTATLNKPETITAYYNSQSNTIVISFSEKHETLQGRLYSTNGQLISASNITEQELLHNMKLPVLSSGIYVLQLVNETTRYSKRIMISNSK
jgi:hypothetical protein